MMTAWEALGAAVARARELDAAIRDRRRQLQNLPPLREAYVSALGVALGAVRAAMDATPGGCPFCGNGAP